MPLTFGTDGVRGVANAELTPELVLSLGRAAARVLGPGPWLLGRDPRISGPMFAAALAAGLAAEGASVVDLGVLPTPAVAATCADQGRPGAMISASHNPFSDNGVKLFAIGGRKLTDEVEALIEAGLDDAVTDGDVGTITTDDGAASAYIDRLLDALEGRTLDGFEVVLDCANGAASDIAPEVFRRAGATVTVLHAEPDGVNINADCGSTHPQSLQATVAGTGAIGLAFDGDADRVLAVDEDGALVDGDHILALAALDLAGRGRLAADTVVVTVMTNLGFRLAMEAAGLNVVETKVGDRYVLAALEDGGYSLGGEQSGHVIFADLATTGDGVLTGLLLADLVNRKQATLRDMAAAAMTRLPQVLRNVRVADPSGVAGAGAVVDAATAIEAELGDHGRVLIRPSGTEPLVRVMVEAPTAEQAEAAAGRLVAAVEQAVRP
ncbi:MAG: phosphoglucosamine mutase [Actinomycetota bacterium]|nr:phosphoglucosamine mutase [Actinomycetota bacterium]